VKAFLSEPGSDTVLGLLEEVDPHCTSRLSFVECHASFARGRRDERVTSNEVSTLILDFARQWSDLVVVELDGPVGERAGELAYRYWHRASDAIHLASALQLAEGTPPSVRFACWDRRLWEAAGVVGFTRIPEALV
jgi:uncharacterized protein